MYNNNKILGIRELDNIEMKFDIMKFHLFFVYFTELLVDALFKPGVKINPEHKSKYIYLLAYAASVCETTPKKGNTRKTNKDDLKTTIQAIEKVHNICNVNKGSTELIAELQTLYQCIR